MKKGLLVGLLVLNAAVLSGCKEEKEAPADSSAQSSNSAVVAPSSSAPQTVQTHSSSSTDAGNENTQSKPTAPAIDPEEQEYLIAKKTSLYIKATNAFGAGPLNGSSGWPDKERKVKAGIEKKNYRVVESFLYFSSNGHARLRDNLKKALDDKDIQLAALDSKAEVLVAALDKLVPVWEKLEQYNKTKKFEDDKGAQGKELMETFTPAYYEVEKLYADLAASVSEAAGEMKKKRMERYKQQGRLLELYSEESIELARGILKQFNSTKDFKNKEKVEAANALLAQLEEKLELQMTEYKKAESEGKNPNSYYSSVNDQLNSFIGNYRKARKDPNTWVEYMYADFNRAIGSYNNIR